MITVGSSTSYHQVLSSIKEPGGRGQQATQLGKVNLRTTRAMVSCSCSASLDPCFRLSPTSFSIYNKSTNPSRSKLAIGSRKNMEPSCSKKIASQYTPEARHLTVYKSLVVPLAASIVVLWSNPANAGFMSGISGIESVPGPQLPQIDFLTKFNEENQKKYAEADARFKESPLLKKLLEQSKLNKEKNRQAILDKYCIRGAEWGVGDCSAEGMTPQEKEDFIAMLKKRAGVE